MPSISLDNIKKRIKVSHGDNQGKVISAAQEEAKGYLRGKIPFVWNATCLFELNRGKLICLFEQYHAAVKIVYLETEREEGSGGM